MLSSDDDWFRPVDVCAAPDGSLMVADWYDGGVGGHAFRDQTTGRIYRIANKGGNHDAVRFDFTKPEGIAAALMSPNIAARDVAARWMIERGPTSDEAQQSANQVSQMKPLERAMARMLWLSTLTKDTRILDSIRNELKSRGATARNMPAPVREQLCRMLGRDNSRLGATPADGRFPPTRGELEYASLAGMTEDPDESVRREIILSLRDVPTSIAGETLKKLAKNWDGRDRWYLEALGLALRHREPEFIKSLFEGSLYGDPIADEASRNSKVALPPYFPTDRNEAYLKPGDELPPANALSKTLGLMWELHRVESLPLLAKLMPSLHAPELQQAADDIIAFIDDPSGAPIVADMIAQLNDNARKTRAMGSLARKLEGPWRGAAQNDDVVQLIQSSLGKNELRNSAITLAAATGDARYTEPLTKLIDDANAASEIRVAALEGLARLNRERATEISIAQIGAARTSQKNSPLAEAAVRVMALMGAPSEKLGELTTADNLPLPLRREALRGLLQRRDAIEQVLAMARENKIPSDLRLEAATLLRAHPDRGVRDQALELFPIKSKDGKPLPSTGELMRRNGDAEKGKQVFFAADRESGAGKTACASCHRVQGQGQWIGPDLSTIGTKYGKAELLNSILNPSAAISYTFRSQVVATNDGRVVTGLPVEETPQSLVLKTAEGERITVDKNAIDERRDSDISLMPEGLIENLSEDELVDLLAYLSTLTKPVSVVGDVHVVGPLSASDQAGDLAKPARPDQPLDDHGTKREWQRVAANAEGVLKMQPAGDGGMMLHVPVRSPAAQKARLVIDSDGVDAVWLGGKLVSGRKGVRDVELELPAGDADLNIRVWAKGNQGVVLTFVSDQPVSFESSPVKP
jgi:putative heme-binding domain-containing protein